MDRHEPLMFLPGWWKHDSGLVLPTTQPRADSAEVPADLPRELLPKPAPVALVGSLPSSDDQVMAYVDEDLLELPRTSPSRLRELVRGLGAELALHFLARLAAQAYELGVDANGQLELAHAFYGDGELSARFERHLRINPSLRIFAEQHIYVLQRLLLIEGVDRSIEVEFSAEDHRDLRLALLGCSTAVGAATEGLRRRSAQVDDYLGLLVQTASYYAKESALGPMARAQELLRLASDDEAKQHHAYVPVHEWCRDEWRLDLEEQTRLGIGLASMAHAWDEGNEAGIRNYISPRNVQDFLLKAGFERKSDDALRLISATRKEFGRLFAELGETDGHLAWDLRAFKQRPFLRCGNGGLVLLSPRFIHSWLTEGFHYRALIAAQHRDARSPSKTHYVRDYLAFAGSLYERYCLRLARSVLHLDGIDGPRVLGEQPYGKRPRKGKGEKTSDLAIDHGPDLILIEVTASRLSASALISGKARDASADIHRVLVNKIHQLDNCISQLTGPRRRAQLPGVDLSAVERIWPIVVTAGATIQHRLLWDYLDRVSGAALKQPRVQPLTVLDPEEFERLCGLLEAGNSLPAVLSQKTSAVFARMDLSMWLASDPHAPKEARARLVEDVFERQMAGVLARMDFSRGIPEAA